MSHDGGGGTFFFDTTHIVEATISSANITGATHNPDGPAPIVITAVQHPFADGQAVLVENVGGNTNANGVWLVDSERGHVRITRIQGQPRTRPAARRGASR